MATLEIKGSRALHGLHRSEGCGIKSINSLFVLQVDFLNYPQIIYLTEEGQ